MDFIFASPELAKGAKGARIFNNDPRTDALADHYPVMAVIEL